MILKQRLRASFVRLGFDHTELASHGASQGVLQRRHAPFQLEHLHVQGRLLSAEGCDLLLVPGVLLLLVREVPLDVLLHLEELVLQGLADVLGLQGQALLQRRFLLAEDLDLLLVEGEVVLDGLDHLLRS